MSSLPSCNKVTPHPVGSGRATRGAVLRYFYLSQKETYHCRPGRKLNSFPTPAEMRSTFPHQVSTKLGGKYGFLPPLGSNEAAPSRPLTEQSQKKSAKKRRFNNTQSLKISTHTRFKQTNKNYSSYQNTGRFKLNGKR